MDVKKGGKKPTCYQKQEEMHPEKEVTEKRGLLFFSEEKKTIVGAREMLMGDGCGNVLQLNLNHLHIQNCTFFSSMKKQDT